MSNNNVRNEVNRLAQQIENLARQVQSQIASGADSTGLLGAINEVVRNSSTLTFTFGELVALEDSTKTGGRRVKTTVVSNPSGTQTNRNYHNVRDSLGRFTRV
jgi:hypothetical protein